jgi:hypothetical protein
MMVRACLQRKNHIFACYRMNFKLQKVKIMTYFIFSNFYSMKITKIASETI